MKLNKEQIKIFKMKKTVLLLATTVALNFSTQAQLLRGIGNMVKAKAAEKLTSEVDKKVTNVFNGKKSAGGSIDTKVDQASQSENAPALVKSYSKYDFIPGESISYYEDFNRSPLGELPLGWNSNVKGEVVTIDGQKGKWLRLFTNGMYLSSNAKPIGENYTIEFDVLMQGTPPSGTRFLPNFTIGLLSSGKFSTTHNSFLNSSTVINNKIEAMIKPNVDKITTATLESFGANNKSNFKSETITLSDFNNSIGRIAHYAIQVQKQRLRLWIDGNKIFDIPQAINLSPALNQLYFKLADNWMYNEANYGLYLTNLKFAQGLADVRAKLNSKTGFSTTGIFFESASSDISPQSYGILKELAAAISSVEDKKIKITGHTDNTGNASKNLQLSKQRAEAIGEYLTLKLGIDAKKLIYEGKGSASPVADNVSAEGMAQNRRVEFTLVN